ncbi:hypothetical protein [Caulobacter sp. 3R27C2-B]|uniref:hypothetical protein n=1 Tax=Caulobacter sp. 3R27C2-B TaxID=2502219 RepID=UPI0010FA3316|nr:hypothetical protein [Caulobacter sp. 3R27C2-B]
MATDLEGAVERFTLDLIEIEDHINAERVRLVQHSDDDWSVRYLGDLAKDGRTILDALASITRERDAMREAGKPFFDLAKTVTTPASGSLPWWQESQDWTVVFSFAGCAVTLGDLRRAAALVNGEGGHETALSNQKTGEA